jgi:hypothetical protein
MFQFFSPPPKKKNPDTYTEDELVRGSMWYLQPSRATHSQVHVRLRDRAMLLISTASAFRGDNTRRLLLSDLSVEDVRMIDLGLDAKIMVRSYISVLSQITIYVIDCFSMGRH